MFLLTLGDSYVALRDAVLRGAALEADVDGVLVVSGEPGAVGEGVAGAATPVTHLTQDTRSTPDTGHP